MKTARNSIPSKAETAPITVVITGEPVAKGRPRITRRGIAYTPAHTRKYEAHGRLAAQLAMGDRPPIEAPVRLELVAELPVPGSWSGRRRALAVTGDLLPTCRPDVDNYIKAGLDSLNEIVVRDDSQIVEITARKRFSIAPKLVMTVFPLGAICANRAAAARGGVMRRDQQRHHLSQAATTKKGPANRGQIEGFE
jgi:Holliday junction resolvase RusA-like endonuclease